MGQQSINSSRFRSLQPSKIDGGSKFNYTQRYLQQETKQQTVEAAKISNYATESQSYFRKHASNVELALETFVPKLPA